MIFYKIFDDESGIKLEKSCESLGSRGYEMGFLLVPKDVTSRRNPLNLKPVFFFGGSFDLLQADPEEDELRLGFDFDGCPSDFLQYGRCSFLRFHASIQCPKTIEN